ncbi:MAG: redoxin domain-containing protein [Verrucomicrobiales bacterium]
MSLPVGTPAPKFTLKRKTADGISDVSLDEHLKNGPVVLLFFPLAFTGVCTQEMCDITAGRQDYENLKATVLGISVDSPFAQEAWAEKESIAVPLLSDLNKETAKAYGVLLDDLAGLGSASARAAFVIGQDGIIQYSEQTPTPKDLPDFDKIKAALAEA